MTADPAGAGPPEHAAPTHPASARAVGDEVVHHSLDAIIVTDASFAIRSWNPAAERLYGIPAADAVGQRLRTIVDGFDLSGAPFDSGAAEATLAATGEWRSRLIHRPRIGSRAGRDVIVDAGVVLLRDPEGAVTGAIAINRDVSASAALEAEIAALGSLVVAAGRARTAAEVAQASLEILSRTTGADAGLVTSMESTYEATATLGVSPRTIETIVAYGQLGGPLARALEPADAYVSADVATAPLREDVREAVLADGIGHLIVVGLRLTGRLTGILSLGWRRPAPVEPSRAVMLQAAALIAASLENARLLSAVEAGLEEERNVTRSYRNLFESSPEALLVETPDRRIVDANPAAFRLYGKDLLGRNVDELVDGQPAPIDPVANPDAIVRAERIGRRLDGTTFPLEVELRAFAFGGEPHILAMVRDLTEQRRLQGELVQAQKMEAIGLLVAGVAHELNNPLASIVAFSQLIRTDPNLPPDLHSQAGLLVQEANRTRVIVQNLLDFARQRPPERVATPLRPLVESVVALQSYVFTRNRIAVELEIPDDLPSLLVDRGQLQQVLVNLSFNSAQAILEAGRPGTLRISARHTGAEDGGAIRIAIADDGPGVPAEMADRLFVPFVTTKAPGQGTGLGLSVSFGIIASHGGTLRHEPTPGGGATFVIELPVGGAGAPPPDVPGGGVVASPPRSGAAERSDPSAASPHPETPAATVRPRVLVLDDEPSIRDFLGRVLTRAGYEPVLVGAGADAVEVVRTDPPAAILCDHRMAGMSGTEFHAAVAGLDPALARRFAFMSGDVLNPELRDFAETHGVHLLAKPFDLATVQDLVATLLGEPGAAS